MTDERLESTRNALSMFADPSKPVPIALKDCIDEIDRLRADGATLRERVKQHPPLIPECDFGGTPTGLHCVWCAESWGTSNPADHPDNGCLWPDVHKLTSAPKEPTP